MSIFSTVGAIKLDHLDKESQLPDLVSREPM